MELLSAVPFAKDRRVLLDGPICQESELDCGNESSDILIRRDYN